VAHRCFVRPHLLIHRQRICLLLPFHLAPLVQFPSQTVSLRRDERVELCEERYRPHNVHCGGGEDEGGAPDTVNLMLVNVLRFMLRRNLRGLHGSICDNVVRVDRQSQTSDGGAHWWLLLRSFHKIAQAGRAQADLCSRYVRGR
jgi:hypothetical protein